MKTRLEERLDEAQRLLHEGDFDSSSLVIQQAIEETPSDFRPAFLMGVCLFRQRRFAEAEYWFNRSIALHGAGAHAHYYLGLSRERLGNSAGARRCYEQALEMQPGFPEALKKLEAMEPTRSVEGGIGGNTHSPASDGPATVVPRTPPREGGVARQPKAPRMQAAPPSLDEMTQAELRDPGKLVHRGHRRWQSFSFSAIALGLLVIAAAWFWVLATDEVDSFRHTTDTALALTVLAGIVTASLAVRSAATRYDFYERRIDFQSGVLWRRRVSLWMYQIEDVWLTRTPMNLLTGDAKVHARARGQEAPTRRGSRRGAGHFAIVGLGNQKRMKALFAELRDAALVERRGMKNWFV